MHFYAVVAALLLVLLMFLLLLSAVHARWQCVNLLFIRLPTSKETMLPNSFHKSLTNWLAEHLHCKWPTNTHTYISAYTTARKQINLKFVFYLRLFICAWLRAPTIPQFFVCDSFVSRVCGVWRALYSRWQIPVIS